MVTRVDPSAALIGSIWLAALCVVCATSACQAASQRDAGSRSSTDGGAGDSATAAPDPTPWNQPMPSGVRKPNPAPAVGFATDDRGALVAFDLESGDIVGEHPLGNSVYDLAWLPSACRLVARVSSNGRAQRVFAYRPQWHGAELELSLEAASEEYWGDPRILGVRSYVSQTEQRRPETLWLAHGDPVPEWQRLGSELEPLSPGIAWPRPVHWVELPQGNVAAIVGRGEATEVVLATLDGSSQRSSRFPLPRAEALATRGADLWVWQGAQTEVGPRLLRFAALAPMGAPNFTARYFGEARPVALGATAHGALSVVEGVGGLRLWWVGMDTSRSVRVDQSITDRYRPLALRPNAAWLATDDGALRFALPMLNLEPAFEGTKLRGPLLVPSGKALGCTR